MLHGAVAAALILVSFMLQQQVEKAPKIMELVKGEGDNYAATEAPALGTPGGIKITIPEPESAATPQPPEPAPVQPAPVERAPEPVVERTPVKPVPVTPPKTAPVLAKTPPDAIRDFTKDVKRIAEKRQKKLEAADKKLREMEEKKAKAAEARRMTKEEFDKQNKAKPGAKSPAATKVARIDGEGIAQGVVDGSTANKKGGAGGRAMTREEGDLLDAYFSLLKRRLKEALDKPPGLSDTLVAIVEVRIAANGLLSGAKISESSGSEEFDHAALAAVTRVKSVGPRPDGKSELLKIPFRMREEDGN